MCLCQPFLTRVPKSIGSGAPAGRRFGNPLGVEGTDHHESSGSWFQSLTLPEPTHQEVHEQDGHEQHEDDEEGEREAPEVHRDRVVVDVGLEERRDVVDLAQHHDEGAHQRQRRRRQDHLGAGCE